MGAGVWCTVHPCGGMVLAVLRRGVVVCYAVMVIFSSAWCCSVLCCEVPEEQCRSWACIVANNASTFSLGLPSLWCQGHMAHTCVYSRRKTPLFCSSFTKKCASVPADLLTCWSMCCENS